MAVPSMTYDELRQAILLCQGKDFVTGVLDDRSLEALIQLGVVVRVREGVYEVTSHGVRLLKQLERGVRIAEFEPEPPRPTYDAL
jgi:hypothetical protein